jgi:hypothetical protein
MRRNLYISDTPEKRTLTIANGYYTTTSLSNSVYRAGKKIPYPTTMKIVQNNIVPPGSTLSMRLSIQPISQLVEFVLRTEEVNPIGIQALIEDNTVADPFKQYSNISGTNPSITTYGTPTFLMLLPIFYGTVTARSYYGGVGTNGITESDGSTLLTTNVLPVVVQVADLNFNFGGVARESIHHVLFFDHNLKKYLPLDGNSSFYTYYDTVCIPIGNEKWNFHRYAFYTYEENIRMIPSTNECVVTNLTLDNFLQNNWTTVGATWQSLPDLGGTLDHIILGRSYPFSFEQTKKVVENEKLLQNSLQCAETLLTILGWPDPNFPYTMSQQSTVRFIHRNLDTVVDNVYGLGAVLNPTNISTTPIVYNYTQLPPKLLFVQLVGTEYFFRSDPYIFIKISVGTEKDQALSNDEFLVANIYNSNIYNYISPAVQSNIERNLGVLQNRFNGMFTQILLTENAPNSIFRSGEIARVDFYDKPIEKLNTITIEFYNRDGEIIDSRSEHSFVLRVQTIQNVLKDTHIDSKTGGVVTTGYYPTAL